MSRNNTGNPIGSKAFLDFEDNVKNLDDGVNGTESAWVDRFGRPRKPLLQMEREFDSAQAYRENEFDSAQTYRESRFNDFIASSGYQFLADYGPGIEFTEYNQLVRDENGEFWRLSGQVELPYTTTGAGIPEDDALVPAGDAVLRQDLADPDKGAGLIVTPTGETVAAVLDDLTLRRAVNSKFAAKDAMWSWWAKPIVTRVTSPGLDRTFFTYTNNAGAICAGQFDHLSGVLKTRVLNTNFAPDDHNAGAVIAEDNRLLMVFPARMAIGGVTRLFMYTAESYDVDALSQTIVPAAGPTNYPNVYRNDSDLYMLYRSNQTGEQWRSVTANWDTPTTGHATKVFFQDPDTTWPYFTTRRSHSNPNRVNIALGWHPVQESYANVHAGYLDLVTGDVRDIDGTYRANLKTGDGLPLTKAAFQVVYAAAPGEAVRLFDVHDSTIAICAYPSADPAAGTYKVLKGGPTWEVYEVCPSGNPFHGLNVRNYFGGTAIDEADANVLYSSREADGVWLMEKYVLAGGSFSKVASVDAAVWNGDQAAIRPMAVTRSMASDSEVSGFLYVTGKFSPADYTLFATDIVTPTGNGGSVSESGPRPAYLPDIESGQKPSYSDVNLIPAGSTTWDVPLDVGKYLLQRIEIVDVRPSSAGTYDVKVQAIDSDGAAIEGLSYKWIGSYDAATDAATTRDVGNDGAATSAKVGRISSFARSFITVDVLARPYINGLPLRTSYSGTVNSLAPYKGELAVTIGATSPALIARIAGLRFTIEGSVQSGVGRWWATKMLKV